MSRLIDADALKATMIETLEQIKANPKMDGQEMHIIAGIAMLGEMIDSAPTIDAVPVVRCRECIHWVGDFPGATTYVKRCEWAGYMVGENGYCVYGERKEAEHE